VALFEVGEQVVVVDEEGLQIQSLDQAWWLQGFMTNLLRLPVCLIIE